MAMVVDKSVDRYRFWHPYYLFRTLGCFPALFYWSLVAVPSHSFSEYHITLISSHPLTLYIQLVALPILVLLRLRQIRKRFHLVTLSPETLLDAWLNHFVAFNVASLGILGGWMATSTYLVSVIGLSALFPKPAYLGQSKLRVFSPEAYQPVGKRFVAEVLNQRYSSVVGFSPHELLDLTREKLQEGIDEDNHRNGGDPLHQSKTWIIWPISESCKRSQLGLIDLESIIARISLQYHDPDALEFAVLDMENSTSLCALLEIWSEDDSAHSSTQCNVDDFVLLKYQAGKEIDRIPPRNPCDDDSSDAEESRFEKKAQIDPVCWSQEMILKTFNLK